MLQIKAGKVLYLQLQPPHWVTSVDMVSWEKLVSLVIPVSVETGVSQETQYSALVTPESMVSQAPAYTVAVTFAPLCNKTEIKTQQTYQTLSGKS